jgi:hypothetical protein
VGRVGLSEPAAVGRGCLRRVGVCKTRRRNATHPSPASATQTPRHHTAGQTIPQSGPALRRKSSPGRFPPGEQRREGCAAGQHALHRILGARSQRGDRAAVLSRAPFVCLAAALVSLAVARIRQRPAWEESFALYELLETIACEQADDPASPALLAMMADADPEIRPPAPALLRREQSPGVDMAVSPPPARPGQRTSWARGRLQQEDAGAARPESGSRTGRGGSWRSSTSTASRTGAVRPSRSWCSTSG